MADVAIEVALYRRDRDEAPRLVARSPGLADTQLPPLERILTTFGERPAGIACPGAVFAQPLGETHVAVVSVRDGEPGATGWASLEFRALVLSADNYAGLGGDPFAVAAVSPSFSAETIRLPAEPISVRDIEKVRAVLQRMKTPDTTRAEGTAITLTVDTAESPTLLGGVQVLVDGGKLVFLRPKPDAAMLEGLWTLLPTGLRPKLWPATFAFNNDLGFDVFVTPRLNESLEGYTTEEQAGDYPAGNYELALQTAAESGDARALERVFRRRTNSETIRLAIQLLIGASIAVLLTRWISPPRPVDVTPQAAAITGIVGVRDPWTAAAMVELSERLHGVKPRAAAVAGIVGVRDPWTAAAMVEFGDQLFRKQK